MDCSINYKKSLEYWADIPATVDGVLGGFGFISDIDVNGSKLFLNSLIATHKLDCNIALDCGAGIGRITKYVLADIFKQIDVVEPDEKFLNSIKEYVGNSEAKIGSLYMESLQEFKPQKKYDVIWNQWVLGYLTNEDLISYLSRCRNALTQNGCIIIKENVTSTGKSEKDELDSSVTRSLKDFLRIFKLANLRRIKQCKQANFPNGLYPVYIFALVPVNVESSPNV